MLIISDKMAQHKIIVYSTKTCHYCIKLKEYLTSKKIKFQAIDVGENQEKAEEMVRKSGQMGVPVTEIDGKIIVGFDQDEIDKALGL